MLILEKNDILVFVNDGRDLGSRIRRLLMGSYNHVAIYVGPVYSVAPGDHYLFEATGRGTLMRPMATASGRVRVIRYMDWLPGQRELVEADAIDLASSAVAEYDYLALVLNAAPRVLHQRFGLRVNVLRYFRDKWLICSEAVAEVFWRAGAVVIPYMPNRVPLPSDFIDYANDCWVAGEGILGEDVLWS